MASLSQRDGRKVSGRGDQYLGFRCKETASRKMVVSGGKGSGCER